VLERTSELEQSLAELRSMRETIGRRRCKRHEPAIIPPRVEFASRIASLPRAENTVAPDRFSPRREIHLCTFRHRRRSGTSVAKFLPV